MEFRVMDEPAVFPGRGMMLIVNEGGEALTDGCVIVDVQGKRHAVDRVSVQDGLICLLMKDGNPAYFERLFRNILVDATLFTLAEDGACR